VYVRVPLLLPVGLLSAALLAAQSGASDEGRRLYLGHCAYCHGPEGEGGRGASLTSGRFRYGSTERDVFLTIRGGVPGSEMPASRLPDAEILKIAAYVHGLGRAGAPERATGNARAGEVLYRGKGGCAACHSVGRRGGGLGPELDGIAARRSLKFLREAVVAPEATVAEEYRLVTVVTRAGDEITGIQLNEDDYSLQLRDARLNLLSFRKSDLGEWKQPMQSLMPSYASVLSPEELDDLVAYLSTLWKPR
jgi:putative heme-binding domain-containing protein